MDWWCRTAERPEVLSVGLVKVDEQDRAVVKAADVSQRLRQRTISKFRKKWWSG
jgi:hypothetical protein